MGEKWYFDAIDRTVSTMHGDIELEVCCVSSFDIYDGDKKYGNKYVFGEKSKANAALIASAPALLEALENMVMVWDDIYPDMESGKYPWGRLEDAEFNEVLKARAAINLARGE